MKHIVSRNDISRECLILNTRRNEFGKCTYEVYEKNKKDYVLDIANSICLIDNVYTLDGQVIYKITLTKLEDAYAGNILDIDKKTQYASQSELEKIKTSYKIFVDNKLEERKTEWSGVIHDDKAGDSRAGRYRNKVLRDKPIIRDIDEIGHGFRFSRSSKSRSNRVLVGYVSFEDFGNNWTEFNERNMIEHDTFIEVDVGTTYIVLKNNKETLMKKVRDKGLLAGADWDIEGNTITIDILHDNISVVPNGIIRIIFEPNITEVAEMIRKSVLGFDRLSVKKLHIPNTFTGYNNHEGWRLKNRHEGLKIGHNDLEEIIKIIIESQNDQEQKWFSAV